MKILKEAIFRNLALAFSLAALISLAFATQLSAQDQPDQDDPPTRVARLGYMQGSVSFQPAGQSEWVDAVQNRPMTTGDQLWVDNNSRAELSLGSAVVDVDRNTGISFLNLDDHTVQIQLNSGAINIRVRRLGRDDIFEVDTPNQAFTISTTGRYRVEASEDGTYSVVSIREGEGESTGNGQTYTVDAGQRVTFEGDSLNARVDNIGDPDGFDSWCYDRDHRFDNSPSARYVSHDVVGYEDLDDSGDWRPALTYGNVWFPRVAAGWAPYREGHWAWIDPWGWTWVDDEPWGYAPFHYGRWVSVGGRWGWLPGPIEVAPVYAPALVVFVGGSPGFGANVGWFPLGPREVYVPSYRVSLGYVNRVNVSNTTVNTMTITNVYNTTIVHNTTNITNVTYVNRGVAGAVTAVPHDAFVSAQPVARVAVTINARELANAQITSRAAFAPTQNSVLGLHANTANRVVAPPAAIARRAVVAKTAPPPPPVPFAAREKMLAANPGQPIERRQMQSLRPANEAASRPLVKQAPPGRPATPIAARPGYQPARSGNLPPASNQRGPANSNPPSNQPAPANRPPDSRPPDNRPTDNRPAAPTRQPNQPNDAQPNDARPNQPGNQQRPNRPQPDQPQPNQTRPNQAPQNQPRQNQDQPQPPAPNNRAMEPPTRNGNGNNNGNGNGNGNVSGNDRSPAPQPNNRPAQAQPPATNDRPPTAQPNNRPEPNQRPDQTRPDQNRPAPNRQADQPQRTPPPARQAPPQNQTSQDKDKDKNKDKDKKKQDDQHKREDKPPNL